jgi:DNA-directed RNA polymerase specialized sigma24 family protein
MSPTNSSVSVWVKRLIDGDKNLPVEKLWERYYQRLVRLARGKLGSRPRRIADEEDVALSAFDSFCKGVTAGRFPQLKDRDNLWRLLVTITARKAYQLNLKNQRKKRGGNRVLDEAAFGRDNPYDPNVLALEQFIGYEPTPEFAVQAAEEYELLLARLPDDGLRQVAQWKMEGFANDEIATKLGCAPRTIERRLSLIRSLWDSEAP